MIIDTNAFLGHYPFRRLVGNNAAEMVTTMERAGIGRALVSSLGAVFYRDAHQGNTELIDEIRNWKDRFIPIAVINPKYAGWQRDLEQVVKSFGMKGVALYPEHHGYTLTDEFGDAVLKAVIELDVPLVLTQRLEDRRQRHAWDVAEDLAMGAVVESAQRHKNLRIMLSNWIGLDGAKLAAAGLKGRCLIDFARLHVLLNKDVPKLIDSMGIESVAFGSHIPFDYVGGSLVKLANLDTLNDEDYEKVAWRNAASFFRFD
ncbi:MAG: amidohydrolase family protein [Pirellulales bacterium]